MKFTSMFRNSLPRRPNLSKGRTLNTPNKFHKHQHSMVCYNFVSSIACCDFAKHVQFCLVILNALVIILAKFSI
jgi:hypothetical protein